jgi:hypothetical protein
MKIPVHYYTEINELTTLEVVKQFVAGKHYIKNLNGKTYLVEEI